MFSRFSALLADPMSIVYRIPAILIGLTVHEWAHAFAAYRLGDPTARNLGRMTLNPIAHIDPFGLLCLLLVGFGWARPVPVNPRNYSNYRRDDIIVSLAGIAANLLTAFVFVFVLYIGAFYLKLYNNEAFLAIFTSIVIINLSLAVFNLLPVYPLDGSHVLESLAARRMPRLFLFLRSYGQYILIALLLTGVLTGVLGAVVNALYQAFSAAALAILGLG